ncbi:hypothetical protein ZWY2020_057139 [Hordeum vulgare]|uniref:Predicted protein n=1 Tax=Hordeum vulgare subsp. vulgare TaxID=112509 RepID=F2EGH5_HORVV|nr:hypothetical protein ZWY2020_057139 [Hordeum vulgare]BAK06447.1 predicted protein [Hordeum vulgare subsp. vulgare]
MAATANMAKAVLLLLLVIHISSVLTAAARPFVGDGHGQWLENGIGMVIHMLGGVKQSGSSRDTHCC